MIAKIKLFLISCLVLGISKSTYSQSLNYKISAIDSLSNALNKVDDFHPPYSVIFTDGQINPKPILGIFKSHKILGGFAEKYTLKDSLLVKLWTGSRKYLNRSKSLSTNLVETFVYNNENLCHYSGSEYYESKGKSDSLVFEIQLYIESDTILKSIGSGTINPHEYFEKILTRSKTYIKNKNELYKN